jgi:hypothetical protein
MNTSEDDVLCRAVDSLIFFDEVVGRDLFISGQMFVYYEFTSHEFGRYNTNDT